ncbi:hypothetical protein H477_2192 [[Clostridium] sordellii ATCC 9714]|nr:hypothetical protein H477_2192 [[Clostridium] sordellii ATCC 9714] [Paeniclostridium sordellii ATCC 9714]
MLILTDSTSSNILALLRASKHPGIFTPLGHGIQYLQAVQSILIFDLNFSPRLSIIFFHL